MDAVTLIIIASMSGRPLIMQRSVPESRCEARADLARARMPTALAWCRSELRPRRMTDELPKPAAVEYLPDGLDSLGMPSGRR
jgi:hypothetical protein